jgi:hypothetical protein
MSLTQAERRSLREWAEMLRSSSAAYSHEAMHRLAPIVPKLLAALEDVEQMLKDVMDVADNKDAKSEAMMAWVHGFRCDPQVSKHNGEKLEQARKYLQEIAK